MSSSESWSRELVKLYVQYFCIALLAIPTAGVFYLLQLLEISHIGAFGIALTCGAIGSVGVWRISRNWFSKGQAGSLPREDSFRSAEVLDDVTATSDRDEPKPVFEIDFQLYFDFLNCVDIGLQITTHPVYGIILNTVRLIAHKYRRPDIVSDLVQNAVIALYRSSYRGECSLGGYIRTIVENNIRRSLRKEGEGQVDALPEDLSENLLSYEKDSVLGRIVSEREFREMLMSRPELQRKIAFFLVLESDGKKVSRNTVIQHFEGEYTRQEIINAYSRLKELLRKRYPDN